MRQTAARDRRDEPGSPSFRPSRSCAYEGWTVVELKKRARQLGISGYSGLSKEELIWLIRNH
ncbi:MAG: Rho termination factor N-terminal domain-containing protein [Mycobacterium sp.]